MCNDRSPGSEHNVWKHQNLRRPKAGHFELETVIRNKFKHSRYYASSHYLKVLKKLQRKPDETIIFMCSRAANAVVSYGIWPKFILIHAFMHVLITYKNSHQRRWQIPRPKSNWYAVTSSQPSIYIWCDNTECHCEQKWKADCRDFIFTFKFIQGRYVKKTLKESNHSCTQHTVFTWYTCMPSIIKISQRVLKL